MNSGDWLTTEREHIKGDILYQIKLDIDTIPSYQNFPVWSTLI